MESATKTWCAQSNLFSLLLDHFRASALHRNEMADCDPAVLEEQIESRKKGFDIESLAASDSLALSSACEIDLDESIAEESLPSLDSLALPPEDDIYVNTSFAAGSLAAADSLALPQDNHALSSYGKVNRRRKTKRKIALLTFSIFILIGIIVLTIVLTKRKDENTGQSIGRVDGSVEENEKDDNIFATENNQLPEIYFLLESRVHNPDALLDISTPEGKAFSVLVEERKGRQSIALRSAEDSYIQRYALLVLYFGTDGGAWTNSAGWSTRSHNCEDWHGVVCSNSFVIGIDLGKIVIYRE